MTAWTLQINSSQGKLTQCADMRINVKLLKDGKKDNSDDWESVTVAKNDTIEWEWTGGNNSNLAGVLRKDKPIPGEKYSNVLVGNTGGSPPCGLMNGHEDDWQYVTAVNNKVKVQVVYDGNQDRVIMNYTMVFKTTHGKTTYDWYYDPEVCMDPVDT